MGFQASSPWFLGTFEKRSNNGSDQKYSDNYNPTRQALAVLIAASTAQRTRWSLTHFLGRGQGSGIRTSLRAEKRQESQL